MAPQDSSGVGADDAKLRELILYIAGKCQDHQKYGATKLNKILFFADFIAYAKFGKAITGAEYFKLPYGPAPRHLVPVTEEMIQNGELVIVPRETLSGTPKRPTPLRPAKLSFFEPWEISLVDDIIETLKDKMAEEVSELSHYYLGWKLAKEKETIPYHSVYCREMREADLTEARQRKAAEVAKRHGLSA